MQKICNSFNKKWIQLWSKKEIIFRVLLSSNKNFFQSQSQWLPYSLWQKYIRYNHFNWIEIQSILQKKMKLCFHSFKMERKTEMTGGWISQNGCTLIRCYRIVLCSNRKKVLKSILCQVINVFFRSNFLSHDTKVS